MTRRISIVLALVGTIVLGSVVGCSSGSSRSADSNELLDGTYPCDALNLTRGNGPYALDCDKWGSLLTIYFNNGGYLEIDTYSQTTDGFSWYISGTAVSDGEEWEITLNR